MNFIYLFIPKPETFEDGKLARLGLVFYWLGAVVLGGCIFGILSNPEDISDLLLAGGIFFFLGRGLLFILANR